MVAYAVAFNFCVFGTLALGGRSNKQILLSSSILHIRAPLTDDKRPHASGTPLLIQLLCLSS